MTKDDGDMELREAFDAQRAEAEGRVPDFDAMMIRARSRGSEEPEQVRVRALPHRRAVRLGGWMSLAAAAAAVGLLLLDTPSTNPDAEFERLVASYASSSAAGAWRSPTAGLLQVPGVDLGAVPSIGSGLDDVRTTRPPDGSVPEGRDS